MAYMISGGTIFVAVSLNGKSGYMVLDSGAHMTLILRDVAGKVGVVGDLGNVNLGLFGGNFNVDLGILSQIQIGSMKINNLDVGVADLEALRAMGPQPMFGLLGAQVFRRMIVELPHSQIAQSSKIDVVLHDPNRFVHNQQIQQQAYWFNLIPGMHAPMLKVIIKPPGSSQGFVCSLLLDTGFGGTIMLCTRKLKLRQIEYEKWPSAGRQQVSAMGNVNLDQWTIEEVRIGNLTLEGLEIVTADVGTGIDGLMGIGFLRGYNMILDVPNRKLGLITMAVSN